MGGNKSNRLTLTGPSLPRVTVASPSAYDASLAGGAVCLEEPAGAAGDDDAEVAAVAAADRADAAEPQLGQQARRLRRQVMTVVLHPLVVAHIPALSVQQALASTFSVRGTGCTR